MHGGVPAIAPNIFLRSIKSAPNDDETITLMTLEGLNTFLQLASAVIIASSSGTSRHRRHPPAHCAPLSRTQAWSPTYGQSLKTFRLVPSVWPLQLSLNSISWPHARRIVSSASY